MSELPHGKALVDLRIRRLLLLIHLGSDQDLELLCHDLLGLEAQAVGERQRLKGCNKTAQRLGGHDVAPRSDEVDDPLGVAGQLRVHRPHNWVLPVVFLLDQQLVGPHPGVLGIRKELKEAARSKLP